ncbi:MAG: restriction endonuclease [Candidatus Bathyarchaeia archaeon]
MSESAKKKTSPLLELAINYFERNGYHVERENTALEGFSGVLWKFDLIVQKGKTAHGVWVKEWSKTIGINTIINIDKASEDVRLANPIIVGEKFSDHAKAYANRRKILLLTKRQLSPKLR